MCFPENVWESKENAISAFGADRAMGLNTWLNWQVLSVRQDQEGSLTIHFPHPSLLALIKCIIQVAKNLFSSNDYDHSVMKETAVIKEVADVTNHLFQKLTEARTTQLNLLQTRNLLQASALSDLSTIKHLNAQIEQNTQEIQNLEARQRKIYKGAVQLIERYSKIIPSERKSTTFNEYSGDVRQQNTSLDQNASPQKQNVSNLLNEYNAIVLKQANGICHLNQRILDSTGVAEIGQNQSFSVYDLVLHSENERHTLRVQKNEPAAEKSTFDRPTSVFKPNDQEIRIVKTPVNVIVSHVVSVLEASFDAMNNKKTPNQTHREFVKEYEQLDLLMKGVETVRLGYKTLGWTSPALEQLDKAWFKHERIFANLTEQMKEQTL